MQLSKPALALGIFIVISSTFTRQLLEFLYDIFGKKQVQLCGGALFALLAVGAFVYLNKAVISNKRKILFLIIVCSGLYFSWQQKIFAERIHTVEYGFLGWFISKDITKAHFNPQKIFYSILVIVLFSCLDEILQKFLPYRVGDLRDVVFNLMGGLWGMGLLFVKCGVKEQQKITLTDSY